MLVPIIIVLLSTFVEGASSYYEDEEASVLLSGTLVDNNNELNVVKGGETIRLTLTTMGPDGPLQYRKDVVTTEVLFQSFLEDFAHSPQDAAFISRMKKLLTREGATLHDDRRTLQLTLSPDADFQITANESIYLNIPPVVLDCKCTYRIPVLEAIVLMPMSVPRPVINAPGIVCSSTFSISSAVFESSLSQIVAENYKVHWSISDDSGQAYIEDPSARETRVHGFKLAGQAVLTVSFTLRDGEETQDVTVERVEAPLPARVDNDVMHVAGTTATLNAHRVTGGGSETRGFWTVKQGSPEVVLKDPTDPNTKIAGLSEKTIMEWRVVGNEKCPETTAQLELLTERARILPRAHEICATEYRITADEPLLSRLKGTWSVESGSSDISFLPSPSEPSATTIGVAHGKTKLRWTLNGDGSSRDYKEASFERKHAPKAEIVTQQPKAYLGSPEVHLEAVPPVQGSGMWNVKHTTCDPPPSFANKEHHLSVLEGLDSVTQPCRLEVEWTVYNEPCESSTTSLLLAVVPQPPTRPVVGEPIVLCHDVPATLTGNDVEVGIGKWEAIDPIDQEIPEPTKPRTVLPKVREGTTVVRWTIMNGNITESADLTITRYELPKAQIVVPSTPRVTVCGRSFTMEANNKHFDGNDIGAWSVASETVVLSDPSNYVLKLADMHPGETAVQWKTQSRESIEACPYGNTANVTLFSWQFPEKPHTEYTTSAQAVIRLATVLEVACRHDPQYYPSYINELAGLAGEWSVGPDSLIQLENEFSSSVRLSHIPMGISTIVWTPSTCDKLSLVIKLERGNKLGCVIKSPERYDSDDGNIYVVGDSLKLTAGEDDFPVSAKGQWSTHAPDVDFTNPNSPTTVVSNLTDGETELKFKISAGIEAFSGECHARVVSLVAAAPPALRAVCHDATEIEAYPLPVNTIQGLTHSWRSTDPTIRIRHHSHPKTMVSNLKPGDNIMIWRLEMAGAISEVQVNAKRDVLALPFGATEHYLTKRIVNMNTLTLPMEPRPEWPANPSEWIVLGNQTVEYGKDTVQLSGIEPGTPAIFQFTVKPTGASACTQTLFTLEVISVKADITASVVGSECELLRGSSMVLTAGGGLKWKVDPEESDFEDLRNGLGDVLYHAYDGYHVDEQTPQIMTVFFKPAYLRANRGLTVRSVKVPSALLSDNVLTHESSVVLFKHLDGVVSDEFTILPTTLELTFSGQRFTKEATLNTEGGQLEIAFSNINMTELSTHLTDPRARDVLLKSIVRKTQPLTHPDERLGWDERKHAMIDMASMAIEGNTVTVQVRPDEWYTIGSHENLHVSAPISSICGLGDPRDVENEREVRSAHDLKITDEPPRLIVTGSVNECDFETRGANITVTAIGCSFMSHAVFTPQYLVSSEPGLEKGWSAVVSRGLFTTSSVGTGAKTRTLFVHPAGSEIYEIPQRTHEVLSLHVPSGDLLHSGLPSDVAFHAEGSVLVNDTFIEVENTDICAEALRTTGHTITLRLHGDSWVEGVASGLGASLIGAISGNRSIKGGWETAMVTDILPKGKYQIVRRSDSVVEIRLPPMPTYTAVEPEEIGIRIPGMTTACSKCLEHEGLLRIFHSHSLTASTNEVHRKSGLSMLSYTLPCARFSMELTKSEVLDGLRSVEAINNGFDSHKQSLVTASSIVISNQTITIPVRWLPYNDTHSEELVFTLPPGAVVPVGSKMIQSPPVVVRPVAASERVGWGAYTVSSFLFLCPVLLFLTFYDFLQAESVGRFVNRQAAKLGFQAHSTLGYCLLVETLLCAFLWINTDDSWMVPVANRLYIGICICGILSFGALVFFSEFTRISTTSGTGLFSIYMNLCCFFSFGCVLYMVL